jgi:MFS family permease
VSELRASLSGAVDLAAPPAWWQTRRWRIVGALSVTETISWGIVYYAFAAFLLPMQHELGFTTAELTGAFSLSLAVSGVAGVAVGRWLDSHSPRPLMMAGSVAAATLVAAWSQVHSVLALYLVWIGLGLAMAAVLYDPAFTVLAKWFSRPAERRRAMTTMTLAGALASFIFLPLSQALIERVGWRDALVALAGILAITTVPLHGAVLRQAPRPAVVHRSDAHANHILRSCDFWLLSGAFFLGSLAAIAMTIHAIPFLVAHGHSPAFAAAAVGLIGISQIPGRLLFTPLAGRLPPAAFVPLVFGLVAAGIGLVVAAPASDLVVVGLVLLGMGNGMATLTRATVLADRYGPDAYGTVAGVAGAVSTTARAIGPLAGAALAAAAGYTVALWTLAAFAAAAAFSAYLAEANARPTALHPFP